MNEDIIEKLLQKIAKNSSGTCILTPNLRLSRFLHQQFDEKQQSTHEGFWITPSIIPLNSWLIDWWNKQNTSTLLLNHHQESALWSEIIEQALRKPANSELVSLAKEAWMLISKWEIPLEVLHKSPIEDIALFYSWAKKFQEKLRAKNWCVASDIIALFLDLDLTHLTAHYNTTGLPRKIILVGFEELALSPLEKRFFTTLNKQFNCPVEYFDPNFQSSTQHKIALLDQAEEILYMALWAYKLWQKNPDQRIACIIPNLSSIRTQVTRVFNEVFEVRQHPSFAPFNISIGKPLNHYSIIKSGLQIIALFSELNSEGTLRQLLSSPFIVGATTEDHARALLSNKSKEDYKYRFDFSHFSTRAKKTCPIFSEILQSYLKIFETISKSSRHQPSKWTEIFVKQWQAFGWLKEQSLNSEEYQTIKRWQQLLKEFSSLDCVLGNVSYKTALQYLNDFANKTIFQPETTPSPINILGTLEAAGLSFDRLWIMGMNEHTFPPAAKPNPFLPIGLQKTLNLPNSSSEREFDFCHNLIARFSRSAKQIVYSYAQKKDEQNLRMTALISQVPLITSAELGLDQKETLAQKIHATSKLESFIDSATLPLLASETITGGSKILEQQALCPFMAFASHRLHIKTSHGNTLKTTRGTLIHETLKQIWRLVKNKHTLQNLSAQELQNLITNCLKQSINELKTNQKMLLHNSHLALEQQCLLKLITSWLDKEAENYGGLFFEVLDTEKEIEFKLEQITLKLRIDRVDRIEGLGAIILDYKTGKPKPLTKNWADDRPSNIQLPLYCIALHENVVGVIFAQIHVESLRDKKPLQGWIAHEKLTSDKKNSSLQVKSEDEWQKIKTEWHNNLSNLAKEFCQGLATISPKKPKETCAYCEYAMLCRIKSSE